MTERTDLFQDREISRRGIFWIGQVPHRDDFGTQIVEAFIDGRTRSGRWAIMTPGNYAQQGAAVGLGPGKGQRYERQADGRWLKVEG